MNTEKKPSPGQMVVLTALPRGLLDGLPQDDQDAIAGVVGKPVLLVGYDEDGRAELEFEHPSKTRRSHRYAHSHTIWVAPEFIRRHR